MLDYLQHFLISSDISQALFWFLSKEDVFSFMAHAPGAKKLVIL